MKRRPIVPLSFVMFWVLQSGVPMDARSCAVREPRDAEFRSSAAVFSGRVKSLRAVRGHGGPSDLQTIATFDVERWWKGGRGRTAEVHSCGGSDGVNAVACTVGFTFDVGVRYLVFAYGRPLETSNCQRTGTLEESADTVEWLNTIKPK